MNDLIRPPVYTALKIWVDNINRFPPSGLIAAWTFGSHARGDLVLGSDLDLRVVLEEESDWNIQEYGGKFGEDFWVAVKDHLFSRLVLRNGVVVDLGAVLENSPPISPEACIVWTRDPNYTPPILEDSPLSTLYPADPCTEKDIQEWLTETLVHVSLLHAIQERKQGASEEVFTALRRIDAVKLIYAYEGVQWAKGSKDLERWLPEEWLMKLRTCDPLFLMLVVLKRMYALKGMIWPDEFVRDFLRPHGWEFVDL